jgi:hypothetical protein
MPNPGSAHSALSDAALRETLDLLGTVVANMAGKLDRQGQILVDVHKAAIESRDAAQTAKTHSDPQRYGRHIGQELDKAFDTTLTRLERLQSGFVSDRQETLLSLGELVRQEEAVLQRLRDDLENAGRWKQRIPFIALFGLALALGLTMALPRFFAGNGIGCAVLGGEWLREPESGNDACVFYAE